MLLILLGTGAKCIGKPSGVVSSWRYFCGGNTGLVMANR